MFTWLKSLFKRKQKPERPPHFSPLPECSKHTYEYIKCIDVQLEEYTWKNVSNLEIGGQCYSFRTDYGTTVVWPLLTLVRVELGRIVKWGTVN